MVVYIEPVAAGSGIPEIKVHLASKLLKTLHSFLFNIIIIHSLKSLKSYLNGVKVGRVVRLRKQIRRLLFEAHIIL